MRWNFSPYFLPGEPGKLLSFLISLFSKFIGMTVALRIKVQHERVQQCLTVSAIEIENFDIYKSSVRVNH